MTRGPDTHCTGCGKVCWRAKEHSGTHKKRAKDAPHLCRVCRAAKYPTTCAHCDGPMPRKRRNGGQGLPRRYCSHACGCAARTARKKPADRRILANAAEYEPVDKLTVFERDKWRCGLCGKKVDRTLAWPHRMSPSLDHVIPLKLGGGHTYANTQLAHLTCNLSKHAHMKTAVQLALC